jgi:hypothetical protein
MSDRSLRSAVGYHVIMLLDDSRVIAESAAELRIATRVLQDHGASRQLLATAVSDTHSLTLLACTREQAGTFARYAEGALVTRLKLAARFERARIRPVRDQSHLGNTFWYVLRQAAHHGVLTDPLHEGSSLPDLLGMRVTGRAVRAAVRARASAEKRCCRCSACRSHRSHSISRCSRMPHAQRSAYLTWGRPGSMRNTHEKRRWSWPASKSRPASWQRHSTSRHARSSGTAVAPSPPSSGRP